MPVTGERGGARARGVVGEEEADRARSACDGEGGGGIGGTLGG